MTTNGAPGHLRNRIVSLAGAQNFRDLGGYPTRDGHHTVWNHLFRSNALHDLTPSDVSVLRRLGVKAVIDLRTPSEVERNGRGLLAHETLHYVHLSVTQ